MRFSFLSAAAAAALLSGCVVVPPAGTTPATPPVVVTPAPTAPVVTTPIPARPDANIARQVVSAEMAKRLPGRNVAPLTDCIMQNATMAEQADLAAQKGRPGAADAVAAIVKRPAASQCIARAAVA